MTWRSALGAILVVLLVVSCANNEPEVRLQSIPGEPTQNQILVVKSAFPEATDLEFFGTVEAPDGDVILFRYSDPTEGECVAIYAFSQGHSTVCGDIDAPQPDSVIVSSSDSGVIVATSPEVTEIRLTTGSGRTYAVAPLGSLSYIAYDDDGSEFTLSLVAGSEIVHTE